MQTQRARTRSAYLWVPSRHLRQPRPPCAVVSDARSRVSSARAPRHWLSCSSTMAAPRRSPPRYSASSSSRSFCAARALFMRSAWCVDAHALLPLCLVSTRLAARCAGVQGAADKYFGHLGCLYFNQLLFEENSEACDVLPQCMRKRLMSD